MVILILFHHVLPKNRKIGKVFNMIARINEAKTMVNIYHVIVNANSVVQHAIQIKNRIMINANKYV